MGRPHANSAELAGIAAVNRLTPEVLLRAYAVGMFPMAERRDDDTLYWIDPEKSCRSMSFGCPGV